MGGTKKAPRKSRVQRNYVTGFKNLNSELIYSTQLDGEVTGSRPFTYQEALDDIKYTELHKQGEPMVIYKLVPIIVKTPKIVRGPMMSVGNSLYLATKTKVHKINLSGKVIKNGLVGKSKSEQRRQKALSKSR